MCTIVFLNGSPSNFWVVFLEKSFNDWREEIHCVIRHGSEICVNLKRKPENGILQNRNQYQNNLYWQTILTTMKGLRVRVPLTVRFFTSKQYQETHYSLHFIKTIRHQPAQRFRRRVAPHMRQWERAEIVRLFWRPKDPFGRHLPNMVRDRIECIDLPNIVTNRIKYSVTFPIWSKIQPNSRISPPTLSLRTFL